MNRRTILSWLAGIAAILTIWWFILPPSLGGRTTLFVTQGISMEPTIKEGDLAVLHKDSDYEVGDVVAYKASSINAITLHRIIDEDGEGRFTTRGDNNAQTDLDHPTASQIYGRMDHHFVGAGGLVKVITSWPVRIIGLGLIAWAIWGTFFSSKRSDETPRRSLTSRLSRAVRPNSTTETLDIGGLTFPAAADPETPNAISSHSDAGIPASETGGSGNLPSDLASEAGSGGTAGFVVKVLAVGLALLSIYVLVNSGAKPATTSGEQKILYTFNGKWDYTAPSKQGGEIIYKDGQVTRNDTVFTKLVDDIHVSYDYNFSTLGKFVGTGTYTTSVKLKGTSGWTHTVSQTDPVEFNGTTLKTEADLNLAQLDSLSTQVQQLTGVLDGSWTAVVQTSVALDGTLSGYEFSSEFPVTLSFVSDGNTVKATSSSTGPNSTVGTGLDAEPAPVLDGLNPTMTKDFSVPEGTANTVEVAGRPTTINTLRLLGFGGLLGAVLLFGGGTSLARRRHKAEIEDISSEALLGFADLGTFERPTQSAEERFGLVDEDGQPLSTTSVQPDVGGEGK